MHNIGYMSQPENVKRDWVMSVISQEAEDNGDGYYGPMHWHDEIKPLENREAAEARIKQLDRGWYNDHAVRYYSYDDAKVTNKMVEYRQQIAKLQKKKAEYAEKNSVRNFKADYIGCKQCGSKVSRKHLCTDFCPVCHNDLRSETTKTTLLNYDARIRELWNKIEEEKKKQKSAKKTMWLIKYEYHC
jgi:hypothetical protein